MTKQINKKLEKIEKRLKELEKNDGITREIIGKVLKHLRKAEDNIFRLDIIQVALSKLLIKSKLTTRKKFDKLCNDEVKKIQEEQKKKLEEQEKKLQQKQKENNSKKTK